MPGPVNRGAIRIVQLHVRGEAGGDWWVVREAAGGRLERGGNRLWDVDPATTDTKRAEWGVPPLVVALEWEVALSIGVYQNGPVQPLARPAVDRLAVEVQEARTLRTVMPAARRSAARRQPATARPG